jgi:hypothetical protein
MGGERGGRDREIIIYISIEKRRNYTFVYYMVQYLENMLLKVYYYYIIIVHMPKHYSVTLEKLETESTRGSEKKATTTVPASIRIAAFCFRERERK